MGALVYALCAVMSGACAVLLIRRYIRSHVPLLMWAALCFALLFFNNALLFVDLVVLPQIDLSLARAILGTLGISALLVGIIDDE
jgi:hypothetical protein